MPITEAGKRLVNSQVWVGVSRDLAVEVAAIEAEAFAAGDRQGHAASINEIATLRAALDAIGAIDVGIYPAASPKGPRSAWQDGWNAGVIAISEELQEVMGYFNE